VQWRTLWQEVIVADVLQGELLLEGQQMADGLVQQLLLHSTHTVSQHMPHEPLPCHNDVKRARLRASIWWWL
jgi:hypothetical protein